MEPRDYEKELYSTEGISVIWYEEDGELKYKYVETYGQSDRWCRYRKGWTNNQIHKTYE